jgi:hypothetical protein
MKSRPTEEQLMAYLYGEADAETKNLVVAWANDHEDNRAELEELKALRSLLALSEDEEVVAPELGFASKAITASKPEKSAGGYGLHSFWLGMAATLLLLLTAGWIFKASLTLDEQGFRLGFGQIEQVNEEALLEKLLARMDDRDKNLQAYLDQHYGATLSQLEARLDQQDVDMQNRITELKTAYRQELLVAIQKQLTEDETIRSLWANLEERNREQLEDYIFRATLDQQESIYRALIALETNMAMQRQSDLEEIGESLVMISQEFDHKQAMGINYLTELILQITNPVN